MKATPHHPRRLLPPPAAAKVLPSAATFNRISTSAITPSSSHCITASLSSATSAATLSDSEAVACRDYQLLFTSQRSEATEPVLLRLVEGSIPADFPRGTYYLTGPGIFSDDHGSTVHPLDGHGYLRAFHFRDGGAVWYSARYVATEALLEERVKRTGRWRFTHRGPFSVLQGGKRVGNLKVMKNVANTSVLRWGDRLMCLWEGGKPYEVDSRSLDTVGPVELVDQELNRGRESPAESGGSGKLVADLAVGIAVHLLQLMLRGVFNTPAKRVLAHYKIDPKRKRLLMVSCNTQDMLFPPSNFTFYEFGSKFELKQKKEFTIPDHVMVHDWGFTENHYVLVVNRVKINFPQSLLAVSGLHPMISALAMNPSKPSTPIYLLPRFSSDAGDRRRPRRDWRVPVEAPSQHWALHVGNAFEEEDGVGNLKIHLQVSVCSYQWFNFQKMFGYNWQTGKLEPSFMNLEKDKEALLPHLVKVSIELDAEGRCQKCSVANASNRWNRPADFPAVNPDFSGQRNTYIYQSAASGSRPSLPHFPFDSVVKLNLSTGSAMSWSTCGRAFVGEPIFVPRGGLEEDDGYIIAVEYAVSKQVCYLAVLDARRVGGADALVAKLEVPKHLTFPLGFHGLWSSAET